MRNKNIAGVLALFLGGVGAHKFYTRRYGWGILYLLFCWTYVPACIALLEAIVYFLNSQQAFNRKYNR